MRQNLSTIGKTYRIVFDGPNGPEYWCGGFDWTKDPNPGFCIINHLGEEASIYWQNYLLKRGVITRVEQVVSDYILYKWPDLGWVVINHRNKDSTIHKVYVAHNFGQGWFVKDRGTIEQTLCIQRSASMYQDVTFAGDKIVKVIATVDGGSFDDFDSIIIPEDGNLKYHFEFESVPSENMGE